MLSKTYSVFFFFFSFTACQNAQTSSGNQFFTNPFISSNQNERVNENGNSLSTRFNLPDGFERVIVDENSFGAYLRNLPLKPHGAEVLLHDGSVKRNKVHAAVIEMEIGKKDLQQCADAIMRLRGEYFFEQKAFDKIHFNLTNGFRMDYTKWMEGFRVAVDGNKTSWVKRAEPSNTYEDFRKYIDFVFMYAGTLSLSKDLKKTNADDLKIGDVFIQGGSPGHAVMVADVAVHRTTGEKIFLLVQSYMPAQEIHVLENPNDQKLSPWYSISFGETLQTPEWRFTAQDLMRFAD